MLSHYLRIAFRNLARRKRYAFINVAGLSIGIAASLLIVLFVRHELTYDRFHEQADRIYLVYKERVTPTGTQVTRDTWVPLLDQLQRDVPGIAAGVRIYQTGVWVQRDDRRFQEQVTYTDPSLFDVFTFPLVEGDARTALDDLHALVISQRMAKKYFGDDDPIGRTLTVDQSGPYTVTGVLADIPSNSSIQIDFAAPIAGANGYESFRDNWSSSFLFTYVLLDRGARREVVENQFPALIEDVWNAETAGRTSFKLEPLVDVFNDINDNRTYAYVLLGIAWVILVIAAINFTNLATARSMERVREIGMRKVLGAHRRQLTFQFLGEAQMMSLMALVLGVVLALVALPSFNDLYGIGLHLPLLNPAVIGTLLLVGAVVGLVAGAYPALFVSGLQPIASLQGKMHRGSGGRRLRHGLVVAQFTLAVGLILGTLVVQRQIDYLRHADLRFDQDNVVDVTVSLSDFADREAAAARLETFKQELRRLPGVVSATSSSRVPGETGDSFTFVRAPEHADEDPLRMRYMFSDANYFATYGIPLIEGRPFDDNRATDRGESVIINEAALKAFGWKDIDGKVILLGASGNVQLHVIGLVRDYHFHSLRDEIAPMIHVFRQPENGIHDNISVRLRPGGVQATLAAMEQTWHAVDPTRDMPYTFVDQQFARLYQSVDRLSTVAGAFTVLAILIACLGLFGLASWMVTQRIKEVGIRKVMGASVSQIVVLLSKDFARLVAIAVVLALPPAYLGMHRWLDAFAYRTGIAWWTFVLAAAVALGLALLTVSVESLRAAAADPAQTLRHQG